MRSCVRRVCRPRHYAPRLRRLEITVGVERAEPGVGFAIAPSCIRQAARVKLHRVLERSGHVHPADPIHGTGYWPDPCHSRPAPWPIERYRCASPKWASNARAARAVDPTDAGSRIRPCSDKRWFDETTGQTVEIARQQGGDCCKWVTWALATAAVSVLRKQRVAEDPDYETYSEDEQQLRRLLPKQEPHPVLIVRGTEDHP